MGKKTLLAFLILLGAASVHAAPGIIDSQFPRTQVQPVTIVGLLPPFSSTAPINVAVTGPVATTSILAVSSGAVTAIGGTGFAVLSSTGTGVNCAIIPPSDTAQYRFRLVTSDADEFPIFGYARLITGQAVIAGEFFLVGLPKVLIEDATEDGLYKVRCAVKR